MRKSLWFLSLFAFAASAQAATLLYDDFSYPDGNIVLTSGGAWTNHSGTSADSFVKDGRYQIDQTRRDDVSREFSAPNTDPFLYATFLVNMTTLPSGSGAYFAHFKDSGTFNFLARVYALTNGTVLPGTFRLGIANVAGSATNVFPLDLATNTDYRVVVSYDIANYASTLWVNPASATDTSVVANDVVGGTAATAVLSAYAFRQSTSEGVMTVDNLMVGNTFEEIVTNAPVPPSIVVNPSGSTNFAGNSVTLYSIANGTGTLTYQWRKDGAHIGANNNLLQLTGVSSSDAGNYDVVVTSPYGSATSQVAVVSVNVAAEPPTITSQPVSSTNAYAGTATFTVTAAGAGPITYQWNFKGATLAGKTDSTLTLGPLTLADAGPYTVTVGNQYGTRDSQPAYLAVLPPVRTNIAYLHTLQDPATWLPTNTTSVFEVEGVVTTYTNITTAANAQFYIQDDTGGIDVFVGGGADVRPLAGDRVRIVGPLGVYNSLLELALSASNPLHSVITVSTGNPLPTPRIFSFAETNDLPHMELAVEGSLVTVTNVYFPAANGTATFAPNTTYTMTNALGQSFALRVDGRVGSMAGVLIPNFAYKVTGVLGQFQSNTATPRNNGYQLNITRPEDLVTTPPPADIVVSITRTGNNVTLTWDAQPGSTYSVYATDHLDAPFASVANGLSFSGAQGTFTETTTTAARFYRVSTP